MWMSEAQKARLTAYRAAMDAAVENVREDTAAINRVATLVRPWKPGAYAVGDVRVYGGIPYRCVQAHDSTQNPAWTPEAEPSLWMQYHGTSPETARPWVEPTGAHDMYRAGEYMIWTDGSTYKCVQNTAYSPGDQPQAWETV